MRLHKLIIAALTLSLSLTAVAAPSPAGEPAQVRDGSHDFDFIYGKWKMPNHRLVKRLVGSHEWEDFMSYDEARPLPGGIGNEDFYETDYWKGFVGMTTRTYDRKTGLWRIYWVDNHFSEGVMDPPVIGKFEGNVGVFDCHDTFNGKPVIVRYTWTILDKGAKDGKVAAHFEQSFSPDDGKTWEVNFTNDLIRTGDESASW